MNKPVFCHKIFLVCKINSNWRDKKKLGVNICGLNKINLHSIGNRTTEILMKPYKITQIWYVSEII